ncbi:MAG: ribosomal-processing cysteine protease Prp [Clostridia bacterium]|nr:ribosomal-processing cysteine protease Prp [Clostridia bacterium]
MIKAEIYFSESGNIVGFNISGHSGFSQAGTDIVCAAVSSAAYMTANTLTEVLGADVEIDVNDKLGIMRAFVSEKDIQRCSDILSGFKMHLILLEEMYSENIKVNYVEV